MPFFSCGFEAGDLQYYQDQGWVFDAGPPSIISTAGRVHESLASRGGTYALQLDATAMSPILGSGGRWLHFWKEAHGIGSTQEFTVVARFGGIDAFRVRFLGDGSILLVRGGPFSPGVVPDVSIGYTPTIDHWIAIEFLCLNSGGRIVVYVDGVQALSYSGDTTNANEGFDQFLFYTSNNISMTVDDIILTSADQGRIGEYFCPHMTLAGNDSIGSGAGSTGGTGTYANVDEIPPDEGTSYNEFTAAGTDRYTTTDLGYTPASILGVTILGQAARDGTIDQAQTVCATDSGGGGVTEALGTISGLGAAGVYAAWQDTFNTDPDTSIAIAEANTGTDFFGILGDVASDIEVGSIITVVGSSANDGDWIVESVAFNTPNTEIVVTDTLIDATADGTLTYNFTGAALDDLRVGVKFSVA